LFPERPQALISGVRPLLLGSSKDAPFPQAT
jgi:hypothetical protein